MSTLINALNTIDGTTGSEVIHWRMEILGRSGGGSVISYSAYSAGARMRDISSGNTYDWSKRQDVIFSDVMLPPNAPPQYANRETLWQAVEKIEKNKNAQLARLLVCTLPTELPRTTQIEMVQEYVQKAFVDRGMCAEINIHDDGNGNPHAHIILTMRSMDTNGKWLTKQQKICERDADGNLIYYPIRRQYKCTTQKTNDWDNQKNVELWREAWANLCNMAYVQSGIEKRVSHKSYKRQGLDLLPTKHLGSKHTAMGRRGIRTKLGEGNRDIRLRNMSVVFKKALQRLQEFFRVISHTLKAWQSQGREKSKSPHERVAIIPARTAIPIPNKDSVHQAPEKYKRQYIRESLPPPTPNGEPREQDLRQYERKYTRTPERSFTLSL